ncbi:hypothetical protein [Candidatus Finniella inopinata]|uniref:Uncharacterized protein n=1 Tax=Candidatus Finniella inopinata TaxID=1696036 RepID=A0A4V2DZS2_9PROT|nr:hypothetical protein [Candidatus Finniella inopinata]RZI46047.1 hypothetical protein EQU50_03700 [Candidatus Finniella inopinata]
MCFSFYTHGSDFEKAEDETKKDAIALSSYFDSDFYQAQYADQLKASGKEPLDHFLSIDFHKGWYTHTDPNSWFNTTLYQRAFPCEGNPLKDFLNRPPLSISDSAEVIDVYAKEDELTRAWLAVEALIRLNRFKINLHISPDTSLKMCMRFIPQVKRGVNLLPDNSSKKSFYHSMFLNQVIDQNVYPEFAWNHAVSACNHPRPHLLHRAYVYNKSWHKELINPLRINFFHSVDEPFFNIYFERFTEYVMRISMGFDRVFFPTILGENTRVIPGYMQTWIDSSSLAEKKEYSISFLLSMGENGIDYNLEGTSYKIRASIWNAEKDLGNGKGKDKTTRFYVSRRNIAKFPEYEGRALPTDSKKPVFDSQFNIAMENCRQKNYFTEKLLGCFVSLTVPIYLGCPNVRDYFDERGMFIAETAEEIISIAQSIQPDTYGKMLPYLQENKKRAEALLGLEAKHKAEFFERMLPLAKG